MKMISKMNILCELITEIIMEDGNLIRIKLKKTIYIFVNI